MTSDALEFRKDIQIFLNELLHDPTVQELAYNLRGEIMRSRALMIMRLCYTPESDGVHVLDVPANRTLVRGEAYIPPGIFYERMHIPSWISRNPNRFYKVGNSWRAEPVNNLPTLETVSESDVYCHFGLAGGTNDHVVNMDVNSNHNKFHNLVEFAIIEARKSMVFWGSHNREWRHRGIVFAAYMYNLIAVAHNPANQTVPAYAEVIRNSLVGWSEFNKNMSGSAISSLYSEANNFYSGDYVYVSDFSAGTTITQVRGTGADTNTFQADEIPQIPLASSHIYARDALGIPQPEEVNHAELDTFSVLDAADNSEITISPAFASNIRTFSATVDATVTIVKIIATPTYELANVEVVGNKVLATGDNVFEIIVTSQDKERTVTYQLTITKQ